MDVALVLLVALLHFWFMILEMYFWTKPLGMKAFRLTPERAEATKVLALNQGLYNGFLAAGLVAAVILKNYQMQNFLLICVVIAGIVGALTVGKKIFFIQCLPAILALGISSAFAFDWQGHRGARGLYPENTVGAMKVALKYPVTTLELDVVISKDQQVVVSHEPYFSDEFCLGEKKNLYQLTYQEIAQVECGLKTHPRFPKQEKVEASKPLLSELILQTRDLNKTVKYSIEIKSTPEDEKMGFQPDYKTFTDLVMATIRKNLPDNRYMIQSFDWRTLKYLKEKYPKVEVVALREEPYKAQDIVKELGFVPEIFSPDYKLLTKADIEYFHSQKIRVIPWTVNIPEDMRKLKSMGVDGIITDYPDLIQSIQ